MPLPAKFNLGFSPAKRGECPHCGPENRYNGHVSDQFQNMEQIVTAKRVVFAIVVLILLGAIATALFRLSGGLGLIPVI